MLWYRVAKAMFYGYNQEFSAVPVLLPLLFTVTVRIHLSSKENEPIIRLTEIAAHTVSFGECWDL